MPDPASRVRPPQQARSRLTLKRLEDAARTHLAEGTWDSLGVAALCRDAESSVGAFYARFTDKDALLVHLSETAASEFEAMLGWCQGDVENRHLPMLSRVRQVVAALQRYVVRHRGVLRALLDQRRALPWETAVAHTALDRILAAGPDEPQPERRNTAVRVMLDALAGYVVSHRAQRRAEPPDSEAFTQMLVRYLG